MGKRKYQVGRGYVDRDPSLGSILGIHPWDLEVGLEEVTGGLYCTSFVVLNGGFSAMGVDLGGLDRA